MLASRFQTKKSLSNQKFAIYNVKNEVSFHLCKYQPWYKTLQIATNHKLKAVYSLSCSSAHFAVFPFLLHILPLPLPLATLLIIVWSSSVLYWAIKILKKKKKVLQWVTFPGKSWPFVFDARRSHCPIGLRFQETG